MKGSGFAVGSGIPSPSKSRSSRRWTVRSIICCSSLRAGDGSSCSHPFVPGHFPAQSEPCSPERAVCSMFLEHGELWDEHLVDDVHDAVVCDHVRLKHMPTIDLDAFAHRGGYRVGGDVTKRVSAGRDVFLSQWNLRDVRPHSEPLALERFEEEAIEQVVRRI